MMQFHTYGAVVAEDPGFLHLFDTMFFKECIYTFVLQSRSYINLDGDYGSGHIWTIFSLHRSKHVGLVNVCILLFSHPTDY